MVQMLRRKKKQKSKPANATAAANEMSVEVRLAIIGGTTTSVYAGVVLCWCSREDSNWVHSGRSGRHWVREHEHKRVFTLIMFTLNYDFDWLYYMEDWFIMLLATVNPYLMIIFCKQLRQVFVKMITFGKVDLTKVTTKVKTLKTGPSKSTKN
jgi:hypothetical protein